MIRRSFMRNACAALASVSLVVSMAPVSAAFADGGGEGEDTSQAGTEASAETGDSEDGDAAEDGTSDAGETETKPYKLTFDSNGGSSVDSIDNVAEGETLSDFKTPTRSGYRFLGWVVKDTSTYVTSVTIKDSDITLVAKWESSSKIATASKVVPYITVKASYSSGSIKKIKSNVKPSTTVTVSNSKSTKRLERVQISLGLNGQSLSSTIKDSYTMGIKYRVRTGSSWSSWKTNGATAGVSGKRIEAIQIQLTGTVAKYYSVYYRVKAKGIDGYLGWAGNGDSAGTAGQSRNLTKLQIQLRPKSKSAPGSTANAFISSIDASGTYSSANTKGTASTAASLGKTAGTAKKSASSISRIKASVSVAGISGGIKYKVYKKGSGWTSYASNGSYTSTAKNNAALAIKMTLTGNKKKYCDVYYRVYVKGYGWMGWAKNGQAAGNTSYNIPVSAYQMKIVYKGAKAPGSTSNYFSGSQGVLCDIAYTKKLQKKANKFSSATNYLILLDCDTCRLGIFKGSKGNWTLIKYWKAGVGAYGTPTVKGTFTTTAHVYEFGNDKGYSCWYATQFYGNYLFHSIVYNLGSKSSVLSSGLGTHVSHGCCRLSLSNAKWLYNNVPLGTKVYVYGD